MLKSRFSAVKLIVLITVLVFSLTSCAEDNDKKEKEVGSDNKPVVAVSIVPEKTFAEAVCGDRAEVISLIPPGNSPENYEPTPEEMEKFSKAKVYFTIGVPTEKANILPGISKDSDMKIVKLQDVVSKKYKDREIAPGEKDPHIWLSPKRAQVMVATIADEMCKIDPDNEAEYRENAEAYIDKLKKLDTEIQDELKNVKNKKFIVFHPAFGYLADDYGLEMYALQKEGKEATPDRLKEMIDLAKKENIKAVFYQAEISSKQAEAFAEEIGAETVQLAPLAPDYIENIAKMAKLMAETK